MDIGYFWGLIGASRAQADSKDPEAAVYAQAVALRERLNSLSTEEILSFQDHLRQQVARANEWRVWAAGYLATGGMSEDAFDYFRLWLVHQGREPFERVLADPDTLADMPWDGEGAAFSAAEDFGYLAPTLLEERSSDFAGAVPLTTAGQVRGQPFPEDDDGWFASTFPRLSARVATQLASAESGGWDRITDADVARFVRGTRKAKERRPVRPLRPLLAASLDQLGHLDRCDLPMLAAHWLADGYDGEALCELAGLSGHEPEVRDLWPLALQEVGVTLPVTDARVAMAWAANRVLQGDRDVRWLMNFLGSTSDEESADEELDALIPAIDDLLDWTERDLRSTADQARCRAEAARRAVWAAVEAMAREDIPAALRALDDVAGQSTPKDDPSP